MSGTTYYLRVRGKVMGPLTLDKLQSLQERGRLLPDHELSTDRRQWRPAAQVVELFGVPSPIDAEVTLEPDAPSANGDLWFYLDEGERTGPVTFSKLQQLTRAGKLFRDDLVWNAELDDWQPAQSIPGLCDAAPSRRQRGESPAAAQDESRFSLMGALLGTVRNAVSAHDLDVACRLLIQVGGYALIVAMFTGPAFLVYTAVQENSLKCAVIGFTSVLGVWGLRFIGETLCAASHRLVQSSPNRMSSTSFMHSVAASMFLLAIASAVILTLEAFQQPNGIDTITYLVIAAQAVLLLTYAGCTALHPEWLNIQMAGDVRAGEEGIGVVAFLLKLCLRWAPVQFGVGSILGATGLAFAFVLLLVGGEWLRLAILIEVLSWWLVLIAATVPLVFYLLMVSVSVWLDLAQSILSIPAKLDDRGD